VNQLSVQEWNLIQLVRKRF